MDVHGAIMSSDVSTADPTKLIAGVVLHSPSPCNNNG